LGLRYFDSFIDSLIRLQILFKDQSINIALMARGFAVFSGPKLFLHMSVEEIHGRILNEVWRRAP
jgi:hypothetical protein